MTDHAHSATAHLPRKSTRPAQGAAKIAQPHIDDLALAALLSSRICHDLVGPVGALNNGVEIIDDGADADLRDHAMHLIGSSARQAAARLQFYRAAFGAGGSLAESAHLSEIEEMTENFLKGGRITLDWTEGEPELDRRLVRLLMNLILIGVEALPRGGLLRIGVMRRGALNMIVMSEGRSAMLGERSRALLRTGDVQVGEALEPKEAPLVLTHRLAKQLNAELSFGEEENRVVVAATL